MAFLDENGLKHLWGKIKEALSNKADKTIVVTVDKERSNENILYATHTAEEIQEYVQNGKEVIFQYDLEELGTLSLELLTINTSQESPTLPPITMAIFHLVSALVGDQKEFTESALIIDQDGQMGSYESTGCYINYDKKQDLTEQEKEQARENIGAISADEVTISIDQEYSATSENAQSGKAVAQAIATIEITGGNGGLGKATDEGGEIFNDYVNNIAGIMGIKAETLLSEEQILQGTEATGGEQYKHYAFDTFTEENFPYTYGDVLNCDNGFHLVKRFAIDNIESLTVDGKTYLTVSIEDIGQPGKFQYQGMDGKIEDMDMETNCYFSCPSKPLAGNIIIPEKEMATASGKNTKALGRASFVAGRDNKALQDCGTVFGRANTAGYAAAAFGRNSDATGEYSFAAGYNADALGDVGFATGQDTFANGNRSSAFGKGSKANGEGSTAFGHNTYSYGDYTFTQGEGTAAGWGNKVPGQVALGHYNKEDQSAILMVGNGTGSGDLRSNAFVVYEDGRAAIKADPKENLDISTKQYVDTKTNEVLNEANNAISAINIPIKAQNTHSLYLNKSEGNSINTSTNYAVVSGANCKIADSSIASFIAGGQRNEIKGQNSLAAGYKNKIYGNGAVAFGDTNTVGQVTVGSDNMAISFDKAANYSAAFGFNNKAQYANQFIIGKYNNNQSTNLFEIGNGDSSKRSNAFAVNKNGNAILGADPSEDMHAATKAYVDSKVNQISYAQLDTEYLTNEMFLNKPVYTRIIEFNTEEEITYMSGANNPWGNNVVLVRYSAIKLTPNIINPDQMNSTSLPHNVNNDSLFEDVYIKIQNDTSYHQVLINYDYGTIHNDNRQGIIRTQIWYTKD